MDVSAEAASYSFSDGAGKALTTKTVRATCRTPATLRCSADQRLNQLVQVTPAKAPVGNTNVLAGLAGGNGAFGVQAIPLVDAPEGGTCHP